MHETNIETLREEAKRLLANEIELLNKIQASPNVLVEAGRDKQSLDTTSLPKELEKLEDECNKLNSLELVLAIVGTMKAGKSTTINAIVGMEVLPNRNWPMTALPTLIRHTPGEKMPKLTFPNAEPVNTLMTVLRKILATQNLELGDLEHETDMKDLIRRIKEEELFREVYEGVDDIFLFLKELNDLVRLATELEQEFPFDSYSRIESLPVIEVEFTHLREMDGVQGRLTLLDTPGPNEAGQSHLRTMLRDQLRKASAVLAVLDYTQLKSDADAEMRDNLASVVKVTGDRLYALVNKFDQEDRNSDDEGQVRRYVSKTLMRGDIAEERIFPVSSRLGYLSSQAKNEILLHNQLPNPMVSPWVEDFAKEAWGRRWKDKINNSTEVQAAAEALWEDSLFGKPLELVIRQAYGKAALLALQSSTTKMVDVADNAKNFLGIRKQSFKKSVEEIQKQIKHLKDDVESIQKSERQVSDTLKESLEKVTTGIRGLGKSVQEEAHAAIQGYFKEGKALEKSETEQQNKQNGRKKTDSWRFGGILGLSMNGNDNGSRDFDPTETVITLENKEQAKALVGKIRDSIEAVFNGIEPTLQKGIEKELAEFDDVFRKNVTRAEQLIQSVKEEMSGFDLNLRLPDVRNIQVDTFISDMMDGAIAEKTKTKTQRRRQSGAWGTVCKWFGTSDWGWEDYNVEVDVFVINIQAIEKDTMKGFKQMFHTLEKTALEAIKQELEAMTDSFFAVLREKVERIRGDLLAGLDDKKKSEDIQKALVVALTELERPVPGLVRDSEELNEQVAELLNDTSDMELA